MTLCVSTPQAIELNSKFVLISCEQSFVVVNMWMPSTSYWLVPTPCARQYHAIYLQSWKTWRSSTGPIEVEARMPATNCSLLLWIGLPSYVKGQLSTEDDDAVAFSEKTWEMVQGNFLQECQRASLQTRYIDCSPRREWPQ